MDGRWSCWWCCWSLSRSWRSGYSIQVGQQIGLLPTVLILIAEAIIGVLLMRHEGSRAWKALNDAFTKGKVPTGELADAALILVGGVLLMLPGFLTDIFGFLFPAALDPAGRPQDDRLLRGAADQPTGHSCDAGTDGHATTSSRGKPSTKPRPITVSRRIRSSSREKSRKAPNQPSPTSPAPIWVPRPVPRS